jgi:NitT/TauT family transport system permease protein
MKIKQFTNSKWYKIILNVLGVVFIFFAWWIASSIINLSLFPTPIIAFKTMFSLLGKASSWLAIGETIKRLIVAFLISFAFALILGVLGGIFKGFRHFFNPVVIVLRTIPTAAVVIILVVLLKPTSGLYIIDFLLMFPILYEAVVSGVSSVDKSIIDALRLDDRKGSINSIGQIFIPMALPYIGLGIIQSLGLGMKVSIMSEILVGDTKIKGLGQMLRIAQSESDMPTVFAIAIIAIIIIALLDILVKIIKTKFFKK